MIVYRQKLNEEKRIYAYKDKNNKLITDKKVIDYINSLQAIPPAYDNVEIFYEKNPKILFQGRDKKGKLQQIYSPKYRAKADKEKFKALIDFGHKLPIINLQILDNIKLQDISKDKIISIILRIITLCGFRVGQEKYQKVYGSTGLSTLMPKHIFFKKNKTQLQIKFLGKKGVENSCIIDDILLIREIDKLIIGKKLNEFIFKYKENNEIKTINAIDINNWLKAYNPEFTSKFFRTFSVNIMLIDKLKQYNPSTMTEAQRKKKITEIIKDVSCSINNSPAICKKSYLNPELIDLFIKHPIKYKTIINNTHNSSMLAFIKFLDYI